MAINGGVRRGKDEYSGSQGEREGDGEGGGEEGRPGGHYQSMRAI